MPNVSTIILEISNFLCLRPWQVDPNKFQRPWQVDPNKFQSVAHNVLNTNMGKKENTEVGTEVGKGVQNRQGVQKNPTQIWQYLSKILLLTPFPTSPRYATVTSTENDLQF